MSNEALNFKIIGNSMPCVEIELGSNQSVIAEAGAMTYFQDGISLEVKLGDGSAGDQGVMGKLFSAAKRVLSNESLFITHFTNNSPKPKKVAFSVPFPGQIVAIDLQTLGGRVYCQKNAFICASLGTEISLSYTKKIAAGFFGGKGFLLQKLEGQEMAFIHAGGSVVEKVLNNETMFLETGSLVAFTEGIVYDIQTTTSVKSVMFGQEGVCLTKLSGSGKVWIQSMSFPRFAGVMFEALQPHMMEDVKNAIKKSK